MTIHYEDSNGEWQTTIVEVLDLGTMVETVVAHFENTLGYLPVSWGTSE
tara:strand:+ start:1769 stop:1915 length:147 start_codon:yes stop_codon:yes gene_type:complete